MIQLIKGHPIARGTPLALCSGLVAGFLCIAVVVSARAADAKGPQISRSIAKEMIAAQTDLQKNQFDDGLKHLETAEATSGLTPFDHKTIDELKAYAYIKKNIYKSAEEAYEAALATGAATPEETLRYTKAVFQIAAQDKQQYTKAIEYGKKLIDLDAATGETYLAITQIYYVQKDCKNAVIWADKSIAYAKKSGAAPAENLYLFRLQCAFDNNDTPGTIAALQDLIRLNGKTDYWNKLLRFEIQDEKDDRNILMIYRIMYNTNSISSGSNYIEMAQLLADAPALPGEAEAVLEKGESSGSIPPDQKERVTRLLNAFKGRADQDRKDLASGSFASEAAKAPAGELSMKLGEVYYGFGDNQKAVDAINAGLAKGSVKHLDEAYVYLGLAEQKLGNVAEAKKAFAQLKTVPNLNPKILQLWQLYAERLGA